MAHQLEVLRKILFWLLDFLKGGSVRKHFKDIQFIQENYSSKEGVKRRVNHLAKILKHATTTVPYYKSIGGLSTFQSFPVVNKSLVRENCEGFQSETYLDKNSHQVTTSGSTGNPFKVLHDTEKRKRNTADTLYFSEKAGFSLGSRLYYLRLWDKQYKKSDFLAWIQNISMHSVDELTDEELALLVEDLKKNKSSKGLLAYNSALQSLCKYLDKTENNHPIHCKLEFVISIAESLNDYVKASIKKYFNIIPVSRYSNSENGILAQQNAAYLNNNFEVNWASYHIEILDFDSDTPVENGELGRIIITDLFNYSMPLIRYDTGDIGSLDFNDQNSKTMPLVFTKIDGRKMDMFTDTKGEFISSHIVHKILQYEQIDQFQFIQEEAREYTIKLKVLNDFDYTCEPALINEYKDYFGKEAEIKIEYVENIPLLASGKRKLVINKAIRNQKELKAKTNAVNFTELKV